MAHKAFLYQSCYMLAETYSFHVFPHSETQPEESEHLAKVSQGTI